MAENYFNIDEKLLELQKALNRSQEEFIKIDKTTNNQQKVLYAFSLTGSTRRIYQSPQATATATGAEALDKCRHVPRSGGFQVRHSCQRHHTLACFFGLLRRGKCLRYGHPYDTIRPVFGIKARGQFP